MLIGNASRGKIVANEVSQAPRGIARLLMLRKHALSPGSALRFEGPALWSPLRSAAVDVVFVNKKGQVVGIAPRLPWWRAAGPFAGADSGIVLDAGACERIPIALGDFLEFAPRTSERIAAGAAPPGHF